MKKAAVYLGQYILFRGIRYTQRMNLSATGNGAKRAKNKVFVRGDA